jgi:tetratricopeptide (TPR) repeat protein
MRTAYRGRAAAYEKKGEYENALVDYNMTVTYLRIEVEILNDLEAPDRTDVLTEAADAYVARSKCLETLGRREAARLDRQRSNDLLGKAKQLAKVAADKVQIINAWSGPISIVIDGSTYRIEAGTRKDIPLPAASVTCQVQTGPYQQTTTLQAGNSYTIR